MTTLQQIIPQIFIPHLPPKRPIRSQPRTAGYAPTAAPPQHHVPYWIRYDPTLADSMMQKLQAYLPTAPGGNFPPSPRLQNYLNCLPEDLLRAGLGHLSTEETTVEFWDYCLFDRIRYAVMEIDQNDALPAEEAIRTLYDHTPDALILPLPNTPPALHYEAKSWHVFDKFAPDILTLAQHDEDGQTGTYLDMGINEEDARSIIFKLGISMIRAGNPVSCFGGHKFMLFSLFRNENTLGEARYGLACSEIIDCTDNARLIIPLVTRKVHSRKRC